MPEKAAEWIVNGTSVDAARSEVLSALRAKAEQRAPITPAAPVVTDVQNREEQKPWASFTEFSRAVKRAADGVLDPRLAAQRGVATGMGIGQDSDGGFLVPEQYAQGIVTRAFDGGAILSRVNRIPVSGNQYHMNLVDETSRATGSRWGGIRGFWMGENDSPTASKPKIRRATLDVTKKLGVLAYVSEEQLEDAPATDAMLTQAFTEEVTFLTEQAIWEGTGAGQPLGITNSSALVTVAAEGAQTADTFNAQNAVKMNARLWSRSQANAAWFIQQQLLAQLPLMTIGQQPVYLPPTGLAGASPFGTLLGKPVFVVEYASAIGDVGDVVLADFSQYALGDKARSAIARSMHVRFVQGEEAFRLVYRVDGLPMWNAALTPFKSSDTVSPFVTLAAR
jgi:HK97 family phage major capsid protein